MENPDDAGRIGSHPLKSAEGGAASVRIASRKIKSEGGPARRGRSLEGDEDGSWRSKSLPKVDECMPFRCSVLSDWNSLLGTNGCSWESRLDCSASAIAFGAMG